MLEKFTKGKCLDSGHKVKYNSFILTTYCMHAVSLFYHNITLMT